MDADVSRVDCKDVDMRCDRCCHLALTRATHCCSSPAASTRLPRANCMYFSFMLSRLWRSEGEWIRWRTTSSWVLRCSTSWEEEEAVIVLMLLLLVTGTAISITWRAWSSWLEISKMDCHSGHSSSRTDRRWTADWQMKVQRRWRDCTLHWTDSKSASSQPCKLSIINTLSRLKITEKTYYIVQIL